MLDLLVRLKSALEDRYAVESEIGRGGMATVFLAADLKHHRQVAIKVLDPELAAAVGTERFSREIEIAAMLDHPHILPVYDSGEADGLFYYVMPRVDGESLRDRLEREKQLSVEEALRITREVADGLQHAHEHGVVHRDIKPANIMLSGGHARIADFGVARAIEDAGGSRVTAQGLAVGSPAYMSPEQAAGEDADNRSDIYALGCVVYEMLAGEPPFTGPTAHAILRRKSIESPPSLNLVRETAPPPLDAAVAKAVATVPADRFATAQAFAAALDTRAPKQRRRAVVPVLIAALMLAVIAVWQARQRPTPGGLDGPRLGSIAVLPFTNRGGNEDITPFVDGIHDDILTQLSKIGDLKVISRTSVMRYRDTEKSAANIAEELRVATLLEGGVQRAGDRVRVNVQLIDARTDDHRWAETYDQELTAANVFAIQTDLARQIARALHATLSPVVSERLERRPTESLEAYDLYAEGRYLWNQRTAEGMFRSIELFQQAIGLDSAYALAHAGLADSYTTLFSWGFILWDDAFPQIDAALNRALELDPLLGQARATRAIFLENQRLWGEAEREFVRALELSPGYATAHHWHALLLAMIGRFDEALSEIRRAAELDPLSPIISTNVGWLHSLSRDYETAVEQLTRTVQREPDFYYAHLLLGDALAELGRYPEAIAASSRGTEMAPLPNVELWLARVYARAGQREEALRIVEERSLGDPTRIALVYVALGETEQAFQLLERAFDTGSPFLDEMKVEPRYDPLRSDPRFDEMLRRLGLQ
jgi:serine/threonine-protein kinase